MKAYIILAFTFLISTSSAILSQDSFKNIQLRRRLIQSSTPLVLVDPAVQAAIQASVAANATLLVAETVATNAQTNMIAAQQAANVSAQAAILVNALSTQANLTLIQAVASAAVFDVLTEAAREAMDTAIKAAVFPYSQKDCDKNLAAVTLATTAATNANNQLVLNQAVTTNQAQLAQILSDSDPQNIGLLISLAQANANSASAVVAVGNGAPLITFQGTSQAAALLSTQTVNVGNVLSAQSGASNAYTKALIASAPFGQAKVDALTHFTQASAAAQAATMTANQAANISLQASAILDIAQVELADAQKAVTAATSALILTTSESVTKINQQSVVTFSPIIDAIALSSSTSTSASQTLVASKAASQSALSTSMAAFQLATSTAAAAAISSTSSTVANSQLSSALSAAAIVDASLTAAKIAMMFAMQASQQPITQAKCDNLKNATDHALSAAIQSKNFLQNIQQVAANATQLVQQQSNNDPLNCSLLIELAQVSAGNLTAISASNDADLLVQQAGRSQQAALQVCAGNFTDKSASYDKDRLVQQAGKSQKRALFATSNLTQANINAALSEATNTVSLAMVVAAPFDIAVHYSNITAITATSTAQIANQTAQIASNMVNSAQAGVNLSADGFAAQTVALAAQTFLSIANAAYNVVNQN